MSKQPKPVRAFGSEYPSMNAAAKAIGVTQKSIRDWVKSGRVELIEDQTKPTKVAPRGRPAKTPWLKRQSTRGDWSTKARQVQIEGKVFNSVAEAGRAYDVHPTTVHNWAKRHPEKVQLLPREAA